MRALPLLVLAGCQGSEVLRTFEEAPPVDPPALELTVTSPTYGAFLGDAPILVTGHVNDPDALVWVEGREVVVGTDGSFRVYLPVGGDFRVVDVEASNPTRHLRERVPVFAGVDPLGSWPGAITLRIGPSGLAAIAEDLGPTIDDLVGGFFPSPAVVTLTSDPTGLALTATLSGAAFSFDLGGFPISLGLDEVVLGATLQPTVDADGMLALAITDTALVLGEPTVQAGPIDPMLIEDWLDGALQAVSGTIEGVVDGLIAGLGAISLGGPIAFETDLLGAPLALSVDALWTDDEGIGGRLGATLGDAPAPTDPIPAPGAQVGFGRSDLALGLHEGLFQLLLTSELLAMLEQDLQLGGVFGGVIGVPLQNLPGGEDLPDADTWCLKVAPGDARAARLQDGTDPLAKLLLPDLRVEIGYLDDDGECADWLVAALELEVDLALANGTELDLGLRVTDGAVLSYATSAEWDEQGVIDGLGGLIGIVVELLGGSLAFDLADLFGGDAGTGLPLGAIEPRVIGSEAMYAEGEPIDGLYALSLKLWD